jgi:predicted aconitase
LRHFGFLHIAGIKIIDKFAELNGKYHAPTTIDPASMDLERWREFKVPEDYAENQIRLCRAHLKMGMIRYGPVRHISMETFPCLENIFHG